MNPTEYPWPTRLAEVWPRLGLPRNVSPAQLVEKGITWKTMRVQRGVGKKTALLLRELLQAEGLDLPSGVDVDGGWWVPHAYAHWAKGEKTACGRRIHKGLTYVTEQSEATCKLCLRPPKKPRPTIRFQGRVKVTSERRAPYTISLAGTYQEVLHQLREAFLKEAENESD